MPFEAPEE
jgi:hypothetical protein